MASTTIPTPEELVNILRIDRSYTILSPDHGPWSLHAAYKKWTLVEEARVRLSELQRQGQYRNVKLIDISNLFVKKTAFYTNWHKYFPQVRHYPAMEAWLLGLEDAPETVDLWGDDNEKRSFEDLRKWLEEKDGKNKGKGKQKAVDLEREQELDIQEAREMERRRREDWDREEEKNEKERRKEKGGKDKKKKKKSKNV